MGPHRWVSAGLALGRVTEEAVLIDTRANLWAEAESLLEPGAIVTLTCQSVLRTQEFQLLKDGVAQEPVHLDSPAFEHRFPLGAVINDTQGLYRCRYSTDGRWMGLSNLVELTGTEPLPPPLLSTETVSWITMGLNTTLLCLGGLRGVTFLLRREGDDQFLEVAEAPKAMQATFSVHRAGNYSCSYRIHAAGALSEPSATVTIEELARLPPPTLTLERESSEVLRPGSPATLTCVAPLSGVDFQLRRGEEVLQVPMSSTSPDRIFFHLDKLALGDSHVYTCRYRLHGELMPWSLDSAPAELVLSDGPLPKPQLRPLWRGAVTPGRDAVLRCEGQVPDVTFELLRVGEGEASTRQWAAQPSADLVLTYVGPQHTGSYSCRYHSYWPNPFQSELSDPVELQVAGS
ncbi:alpha-1B-glycoprotein isoform X4 [Vicugna pacos]|uniref:Alpha-1B-glycoprotein isoform X4 n=1 Tax=Vicugna pacos TaxID=30538 RepID=A0ABM5DNS5_VICPA